LQLLLIVIRWGEWDKIGEEKKKDRKKAKEELAGGR